MTNRHTLFSLLCLSAASLGGLTLTSQAATSKQPTFDCKKATSAAEKLICQTPVLAELDQELGRLYKLALNGKHMTADRKKELTSTQIGWVKGRNDCWKESNLKQCVTQEYVQRIHELRQGYADSRSDDKKGISSGPWVLACQPFDALIGMTHVNASTRYTYLEWREQNVTLTLVPGGSGSKYVGKDFEAKSYELWLKGKEATFTLPGQKALKCKVEVPG